jgi:hypothetical protein
MQLNDNRDFGASFVGLNFWQYGNTYGLGELTNGCNDLHAYSSGFLCPDFSNGEFSGFVFTAFQVLLVRPTEGL